MAGLIGLLRLYQRTLSRLLPGVCRFQPSCSQYAVEALQRHGLWRGGGLALRRLVRCHPFHPGGYDPVPFPGPNGHRSGERCHEARQSRRIEQVGALPPPAAGVKPDGASGTGLQTGVRPGRQRKPR